MITINIVVRKPLENTSISFHFIPIHSSSISSPLTTSNRIVSIIIIIVKLLLQNPSAARFSNITRNIMAFYTSNKWQIADIVLLDYGHDFFAIEKGEVENNNNNTNIPLTESMKCYYVWLQCSGVK